MIYATYTPGAIGSSGTWTFNYSLAGATHSSGKSFGYIAARKVNSFNSQFLTQPPTESFMVVGGYPNGNYTVSYSYDGLTWIPSQSGSSLFPGGSYGIAFVAWNGQIWLAGGLNVIPERSTAAYSSDGINWTASSSGTTAFPYCFLCAAWNGQMWIGAGGSGSSSGTMAYSYDGINWTSIPSPISQFCSTVAWNGSLWVAGGVGNNRVAYSYDGFTWTQSSSGQSTFLNSCNSIVWTGTLWIGGGQANSNGILAYSYDAINWTTVTNNVFLTQTCKAIAWNGSVAVAVGNGNGNNIAYSTNGGISWSTTGFTNAYFASISWNGQTWLAGGYQSGGSGILLTSTNGMNWSKLPQSFALSNQYYTSAARKVLSYNGSIVKPLSVITTNNVTTNGQLLTTFMQGSTYILTSSGSTARTHSFYTTTNSVVQGFFVYLKNGNSVTTATITVWVNGTSMATSGRSSSGNGIVYPFSAAGNNSSSSILYYDGTNFKLYN